MINKFHILLDVHSHILIRIYYSEFNTLIRWKRKNINPNWIIFWWNKYLGKPPILIDIWKNWIFKNNHFCFCSLLLYIINLPYEKFIYWFFFKLPNFYICNFYRQIPTCILIELMYKSNLNHLQFVLLRMLYFLPYLI